MGVLQWMSGSKRVAATVAATDSEPRPRTEIVCQCRLKFPQKCRLKIPHFDAEAV